jgi:hypothetical protein
MNTQVDEIEFLREQLIILIDTQSEFRTRKAVEFPEDERNAQSAEALIALGQKMECMPATHTLWVLYTNAVDTLLPDGASEFSQIEEETLRGYGFYGREDGDPVKFLERFIGELQQRCLKSVDARLH